MTTIWNMDKETADRTYGRCNRCEGGVPCPESSCIWAGVLANGGEGKVFCTAPKDMDKESRTTRFGM